MAEEKTRLLIIGSSHGVYGGIEAFMIAIAEAAIAEGTFDVKLCFKLVRGKLLTEDLKKSAENVCPQVFFTERASFSLFRLIVWADVLHVQNTPPDIIFIARFLFKKIYLTVHNWKRQEKNLHNILWGFAIKMANRRWFNSRFVWNTWEPIKKSIKSDCVPTVCRLPSAWCVPEKRKGFLFIGRWIENKGIEELIEAYSINNFNTSDWPLTIVGDGPLKPKIISLINDKNIHGVHMPGFVTDTSKAGYLSSTCWLMAPAKTKEDLGLTPIEARSVGVPSIVTNDGGLPEAGGDAALIAEPGNVADLARCMKVAADMDIIEYTKRCDTAFKSLSGFLKPMSFYFDAYKS